MVAAYVARHPSRSYTLNRLGDRFPDFIALSGGSLSRSSFVADLARLELLVTEVFDAPETRPVTSRALERIPAEAWAGARLVPIAALRLCELAWPAGEWLDARESGRRPAPRKRATRYVLYRRNYGVRRLTLEPAAFELLGLLVRGKALGAAVKSILGRHPSAETKLQAWFRDWTRAGLFRAVERAPARRRHAGPGRIR